MTRLWLPPKVSRELAEQSQEYNASLNLVCQTDEVCDEWNRELKRLDPYLRMVKAPERPVLGLPLHPAAYHILRDNPTAPTSVIPIVNGDGSPRLPPGRLLEELKGMDLQDVRVERMRERIQRESERAEERRKERVREERQEDTLERWRAVSRTQVSMNPDAPWTQNAAGRRGVKKAA